MRPLPAFAFASFVVLALVAACGGSSDSGLFDGTDTSSSGGSGTSGASSSGTSGASSSGTSGASSSGTSGASSSGTSGASSGTSGTSGTSSGSSGTTMCNPMAASPCGATQFCKASSCTATTGVCTTKPTTPGNAMNPVCGCDHLTYWNAELAAAAGVNVGSMGQCGDGVAVKCTNGIPKCAGGAFCNENVGPIASCAVTNGANACWVMPATCPTATQTEKACNGSGGCRTLCDAIKNERTFGLDSLNCP